MKGWDSYASLEVGIHVFKIDIFYFKIHKRDLKYLIHNPMHSYIFL
jgi:hypothetical protein